MSKQKKKVSDFSTYEMNDDNEGSNNYYQDFDFSDGEGSTGSHGLNDNDDDDDDLYMDAAAAERKRKSDRAKARAQRKQAQAGPSHGGGLEALMAQAPTRNNSIGILGDREPVRRTRPAPPLRTRSGGVMKLNRKISRTVTDTARTVVGAATTVAEVATSVARGREEERDGERVRSSSLGALTRKLTSRAERKANKEAAQAGGGMGNLSLDDTSPAPKQGRMRESSIGALSRRARRQRWKSVDDAEDLDLAEDNTGEMDLNQQSPLNSPVRQRKSAGAITTNKARRERWKSVDDAEELVHDGGEFELKMDDSPKTTPKKKERKRANSIGAINAKTRREQRKKSVDTAESDDHGEKKTKKKGKKSNSASDDEFSDDDIGEKKTKRKIKRSASKASSLSDEDSSSDDEGEKKKKTKRKVKRSTSKADSSDDDSSDEGMVRRRRKASTDKPRKKKASKSPKPPKKKAGKKAASDDEADLDLGGGQARGRRVGRRSSLGTSETMKMQDQANEILKRTQQANRRWADASKEENSIIERRARRRASIGASDGPGR